MLIVTPSDFTADTPAGPASDLAWAQSPDGQLIVGNGTGAASLLPPDDEVVFVLPPRAVSWHRVAVPKVSASRLRAALDGLLEDRLLADTDQLHFALEPGGKPGQTLWVAACEMAPLKAWLRALDAAGRPVSRIAPSLWPLRQEHAAPGGTRSRLFGEDTPDAIHWVYPDDDQAWLASASVAGVSCVPLREGASAQAAVQAVAGGTDEGGIWLADPAVSAQAERLLDRRLQLMPLPAWLLRCASTDWNLAQFELSLSSGARRTQRLRRQWQQFRKSPAWRPARWALGVLLVANLVGLNAAAWHERRTLADKQQAVARTLTQTFPQVTLVLDAPVQMQRELTRLQQASGLPAAGDLESLLAAVDRASNGQPLSPGQLVYASGEARLSGWRASEEQLLTLRQGLERQGWRVRFDGSELTLQAGQP